MAIMVVAEGDEKGGAEAINRQLHEYGCPFSTRTVTLGHLQRGGVPTPEDRRRATQMGSAAVAAILAGKTGMMVGTRDERTVLVPLEETYRSHRPVPLELLDLVETMML